MQEAIVRHLVETGDASTAAQMAGFSKPTADAWRLLRIPHVLAAVDDAMKTALAQDAPAARHLLRQYVTDPKMNPKIRLDAAKTLLDRSGHIAPKARDERAEREKSLHEMSADELRAMVDRLETEVANRAMPVLGASAAPIESEDGSID
jgi:phage terminase small subunit